MYTLKLKKEKELIKCSFIVSVVVLVVGTYVDGFQESLETTSED